jgi:hypothetical protein
MYGNKTPLMVIPKSFTEKLNPREKDSSFEERRNPRFEANSLRLAEMAVVNIGSEFVRVKFGLRFNFGYFRLATRWHSRRVSALAICTGMEK